MCFFTAQDGTIHYIAKRFKATIDNPDEFLQSDYIVGFEYLATPIILDKTPDIVSTNYHWGLIPSWAKDIEIRKHTLNARIESIDEKKSFKDVINNRCLIIASGYFEWHWNDEKGKVKEKYFIRSQDDEIFAFAGLYSDWKNPATGEVLHTYTMLTTEANESMKYVHNHKQRMPIMLKPEDEKRWLDSSVPIKDFAYPKYDASLFAIPV